MMAIICGRACPPGPAPAATAAGAFERGFGYTMQAYAQEWREAARGPSRAAHQSANARKSPRHSAVMAPARRRGRSRASLWCRRYIICHTPARAAQARIAPRPQSKESRRRHAAAAGPAPPAQPKGVSPLLLERTRTGTPGGLRGRRSRVCCARCRPRARLQFKTSRRERVHARRQRDVSHLCQQVQHLFRNSKSSGAGAGRRGLSFGLRIAMVCVTQHCHGHT